MNRDYPKIEAKTWKWILALILTLASFYGVSLLFYYLKINNEIIMASAVSAISLLSLLTIDKKFIKKIFLPIRAKDLLYIIIGLGFSLIAIVISSILVQKLGIEGSNNPIFDVLTEDNFKSFFLSTLIQFIAEEIIFIIPFLFIINKVKIENNIIKTILAILISSIIFGAMHLSTYDFNILQAVLIISIIRTGLSMSYVISKNLSVTYIIHIIYDWTLIFIYIAAGQMIK
ncbi:MAG: CPBP family glutamic-type intramembrane protease [Peptoniphilus harei]|nr:CPBP family glutamic-type intramembrane protease [Peptoniphilus harei]MDU4045602.1 CPBP family glutamic-type intramembrane protease [Peptoniphilus harei]